MMSEAMNSAIFHMQCLDQDQSSINFPVTDDELSSGSEEDNEPEESFENQGDDRLSVQDIIHYFESKAEVCMSTTKNLESNIRQRSTIASPERSVASRRCNAASNELSQVYIDDRTSGILQAHTIDVSSQSNKSERDDRRFDGHNFAFPDDSTFSSHESWIELQSDTIRGISRCNVDVLNDSEGRKGIHPNDFTPAYETNLKKEQYLLAYDSKLRLKSEIMRLPACNVGNNGDSFPNLAKYETEILDDMNCSVYPKNVASNCSSFSLERRGVWDPVLQAHMYLTKDLDKLTSQWKDLREVEKSVSNDSFLVPARFMSKEQPDNSWKRNLNVEAEPIICQVDDAFHVEKKQSDEERPPYYDDLLMIAERSFGECTSNRSSMFPLDCDVKLMNDRSYDYQQNSKRREENSGQNMSAWIKPEPPGFRTTVKTLHPWGRGKDLIKTESQLPVRSVKSIKNDTEVTSRAGILISKKGNLPKVKTDEETVKRVAHTRSEGKDRMPAQRNISGPVKSVDTLRRVSSFQLNTAKPQNMSKSSPSSSNTGKAMLCHMDLSSDSTRSSATDAHLARSMHIQKHLPTAVNRSVSVNEKPHNRSVPCAMELKKDTNNDKTLRERSKTKIVRQPNIPIRLRKVEKKL